MNHPEAVFNVMLTAGQVHCPQGWIRKSGDSKFLRELEENPYLHRERLIEVYDHKLWQDDTQWYLHQAW